MDYKILAIDDEENMHVIASHLLGDEFEIFKANNSQEAIDILSEQTIHLILSDIHMPGLSGLDFLESLKNDDERKQIPFLIMTNLPSAEKEQKAYNLGAADFIDKSLFVTDKESALERIRMKLVSDIQVPDIDEYLLTKKNLFISKLLETAISKDFDKTTEMLTNEMVTRFSANYACIWTKDQDSWKLLKKQSTVHNQETESSLNNGQGHKALDSIREPYFINNLLSSDKGFYKEFSNNNNLSAEITVPVFTVDERKLLLNNMEVPDDASVFAVVIIKRNKLFSTKEFEVISRLVTRSGSILWRLFKN